MDNYARPKHAPLIQLRVKVDVECPEANENQLAYEHNKPLIDEWYVINHDCYFGWGRSADFTNVAHFPLNLLSKLG